MSMHFPLYTFVYSQRFYFSLSLLERASMISFFFIGNRFQDEQYLKTIYILIYMFSMTLIMSVISSFFFRTCTLMFETIGYSFGNKFSFTLGIADILKYLNFYRHLSVLCWQLFDIHTSGLLAEIHTGHHSTVQYCDFSPHNHLAVVALSQYCVEVRSWIYTVKSGSPEVQEWQRMGCLNHWLLRMFAWEIIRVFSS